MGDAPDIEAQSECKVGEVEMEAAGLQPPEMDRKDTNFGLHGVRITFKDLSYHVPDMRDKKSRAYLLKSVSGWFEPKQMAALMGPSGSGKTTLLDLLAGRKNAGVTEGLMEFGGQAPTRAFLRRYTGYVEQFDTLLGILTVEEMLLYTAELKRSMNEPLSSKRQAVDEIINMLALDSCRDVLIGDQMSKGISGGQAKRTNIGIALVTNPRVLFLDEPTSGLDSYTANEVMTVVKGLESSGVTICATIHSPSQYTFHLFDRLIMLVRGQVVFFGPTTEATSFAMSTCPKVKEMSDGYNDAEFLVDLVTEADRQGMGHEIADGYQKSSLRQQNEVTLDKYINFDHQNASDEDIKAELSTKSATVTPWYWGLRTLIKYRSPKNWKDPNFLGPRVFDKVLIGLLIMTLYLGKGDNYAENNLMNIASVLFIMVVLPAYGAASYVPALVVERALFVRERNDGLYYTVTYLLSKIGDELLVAALTSCGMTAFVFFGVQLRGEWVCFWIGYYISLSVGIVLAYFIAAISPNLDVANALLPLYVTSLIFFIGFLFRLTNIPPWWYWYSFIAFPKYTWGALMANQFGEEDPTFSGTTFLRYYGLETVDKWRYCGYGALFFIFFFLATLTVMSLRSYQRR